MTEVISRYDAETLPLKAVKFMAGSLGDFGWSESQLEDELATNSYVVYWILEADGQAVAYVAGQLLFGELELIRVYTHPSARGRGYGKRLLNTILQEEDLERSFLEVRSHNTAAVRLYAAVGFEMVSVRENYYKHPTDDAMMMTWREE